MCHDFKEPTQVTESLTVLVTADVAIGLRWIEQLCIVVLVVHEVDRTSFFSLPLTLILGKRCNKSQNVFMLQTLSIDEHFY